MRAASVVGGEGGELLGGHSLREDKRAAGLSWLLKAWGGETLDDLTRGAGLSLLPGRPPAAAGELLRYRRGGGQLPAGSERFASVISRG